jgi:hypothetical protein
MYFNDPMLYGATLPYTPYTADAPVHTPYLNQFVPPYIQQWQKFLPYQQLAMQFPLQQFQQFPQQFPQQVQQFPQQFPIQQYTPYMHGAGFSPFFHNYNLPSYGWQRPGIF